MILMKRIVRSLLLIVTMVYLISGFGIAEFKIVESITFGLFTKKLAFEIHEYLWIPFAVLLALHVFLPLAKRWLRPTI